MNIQIIMKNKYKEIDDTITMTIILKQIAQDLENGIIDGYYENFEWHYICEEI